MDERPATKYKNIFSTLVDFTLITTLSYYVKTSGFWPRVRARVLRAPVFLGSLTWQTGRCAPPRPSQLHCFLFTLQNFPLGPNSGPLGKAAPCWATLHLTELCCTLLTCTLMSCAAPYWAKLYLWDMLHSTELRSTLSKLRCSIRATLHLLS